MLNVQEHFHAFDSRMHDILNKNLNPSDSGSFLGQAHVLINAEAERVNASLTQALHNTKEVISQEATKIQDGRERLDRKMDPANTYGYLAALIKKMEEFDVHLSHQFSETDRASFVGKLQTMVDQHFGADGQVLDLIQQQLMVDPNSSNTTTPLNQIYHGLKQEIASLRDSVMKMVGQQEMLEQTSKKGFPFEDLVYEELQRIARPFGEIVEDTSLKVEAISGSKKGDYVYHITNSDHTIVLDAKNYSKLKSLPAMLGYIKEAARDRSSKFGIIVVPEKENLQKQIGSWNVYGKAIITPLDYLEISIKFAKFMIQLDDSDSSAVNIGMIRQKLESVQRKMKEVSTVKSKLTKLSNGVAASVADIQENLDSIRLDVNEKILEIEAEFQKG
jgi:hypothetical protein